MPSTTFIPKTPEPTDVTVANNGFFPSFSLNTFRSEMRVGNDIDSDALKRRLQESIVSVNDALSNWKLNQLAAGYMTLSDVPSENYGDDTRLTIFYRQACFARAKRILIEQQRGLDTGKAGQDRADVMMPSIDDLRIQEDSAIRAIRGEKGSIHVALL